MKFHCFYDRALNSTLFESGCILVTTPTINTSCKSKSAVVKWAIERKSQWPYNILVSIVSSSNLVKRKWQLPWRKSSVGITVGVVPTENCRCLLTGLFLCPCKLSPPLMLVLLLAFFIQIEFVSCKLRGPRGPWVTGRRRKRN